jgi:hypothetical protein
MTRDELYALVWSKPVTEVGLLVGMTGTGLAKACRRNGVHVPPRGYWARLAVGQVLERAPPPDGGALETGVHLKGTPTLEKADVLRTMIRRRTAVPRQSVDHDLQVPADDVAAMECARILVQGLRQQLRDAAAGYLSSVAEALPTFDEPTARAAGRWIDAARAAVASAGPAEEVSQALRARSRRPDSPQAWLSTLVCTSPTGPPRRRARRDPQR